MTFSNTYLSLISWFSPRSNWTSYSSPHPPHHPWVTSHPRSPTHPFWKITSDVGCNSFNVMRHASRISNHAHKKLIVSFESLFTSRHCSPLLVMLLYQWHCSVWWSHTCVPTLDTFIATHPHLPRNILHTAGLDIIPCIATTIMY